VRPVRSTTDARRRRGPQLAGSAGRDRGSVTAETAVVLPGLVVVLVALLWLVAALGAHLRCVDAAREAARAVARGESMALVHSLVAAAAPGASVQVLRGGDTVTVTVRDVVDGPGGVFARLPGAQVSASTTALTEQSGSLGISP
jgi:hypothetical protein